MFKLRVFDAYEKFLFHFWGPNTRLLGQVLNRVGLGIQGSLASDDRLVPSLRSKRFRSHAPDLDAVDFIAPNSAIIGQVSIGEKSSVWYNSVLRGDQNAITIGKNSVIQDLVTLAPRKQNPLSVGDNVYVGPNATLESCTIENNAFIGMGATLRNGARVESYGVVAAGAVIAADTVVPSYQIWAGNPARYLRDLSNEEKEVLDEFHTEMQSLAKVHAEETEKPFRQIVDDLDKAAELSYYDPEELAMEKMREIGLPVDAEDEELIEQRVFYREPAAKEEQHWKKNYDPYEQDVYNFPDNFKIYGENYERYEELKKYFNENPDAELQVIDRTKKIKPKDDSPWTRKF